MNTINKKRPSPRKNNTRLYQEASPPSREWACPGLADTRRLARALIGRSTPNVWSLRGPLGSGKTVFARTVLRALGWRGRVTSPTFVLRHDYNIGRGRWPRVVHVDAYRVRDHREELALDLASAADDPGCLTMIEWPQKLRHLPGRRRLEIRFSVLRRGRKVLLSRAF